MLINEIINLEERINLTKLIQKYKPKSAKPKAKSATPKRLKTPAAPKPKVIPKAKPISPPRSPKPFNTTKSLGKSVGPKQIRMLPTNPNMQTNQPLATLPQNVTRPRSTLDMDLYQKMEFVKDQAQKRGVESSMTNREIDSKTRNS